MSPVRRRFVQEFSQQLLWSEVIWRAKPVFEEPLKLLSTIIAVGIVFDEPETTPNDLRSHYATKRFASYHQRSDRLVDPGPTVNVPRSSLIDATSLSRAADRCISPRPKFLASDW
jgi:hypothetical protein